MRRHQLFQVSLLVTAQLFACTAGFAESQTDTQLKSKLVGRWQELRELGCESHQQTMQLRPNGTFQVNGIIRTCDDTSTFVWRGKWRVKDSKFWYKTTYSSPKDLFPIGEELSDQIISVSASEWVMKEESTGNESHAFRVK